MIELTPESRKSTIINIDTLDGKDPITDLSSILCYGQWKELEPYFKGLASVKVAIYPSRRGVSYSTYLVTRQISNYIDCHRPSLIHFDTISLRAVALLPQIKSYPVCISIHDPKPHSGEFSWKTFFAKRIFYKRSQGFIFYSKYSLAVFDTCKPAYNVVKTTVRLTPYTVFNTISSKSNGNTSDVLFIGRMSKYKGIDILLKAIPLVLDKFPETNFLLAGRSENFMLPTGFISKYPHNIKFINRYILPSEIPLLIRNSKLLVCPYRDATQSGVLMTGFALGKTAIVTNAGSFPEYVKDNYTGLISSPDPVDLANKILFALNDDHYLNLEANVSLESNGIHLDGNQIQYERFYKEILEKSSLQQWTRKKLK